MIKKIKNFLKQKKVRSILTRPYSLTTILSLYDGFIYKLISVTGEKVGNVLVHYKNKQFEFIVDFAGYTPGIVKKINSLKRRKFFHGGIDEYYKWMNKLKSLASKKIPNEEIKKKNIFNLISKINAFWSFIFTVWFIHKDLKIPINDKLFLKKCKKARLDTEKFTTPVGKGLDLYSRKLKYIPDYLRGYKPSYKEEFIIFNNHFIYDKKIIKKYRELYKRRFETDLTALDKKIIGTSAFKGKIYGKTKVILSKKDFSKMRKGNIVVANSTTPDYLPVIKMASAIVSDTGGFLCHAAIVSRELKIPCVVGTETATKIIRDGDLVEVDANKGIIKIIKKAK